MMLSKSRPVICTLGGMWYWKTSKAPYGTSAGGGLNLRCFLSFGRPLPTDGGGGGEALGAAGGVAETGGG